MSFRRRVILVVDDEPSYRISLRDCLQSEGYEMRIVATAAEALADARDSAPDLVIADWMLGGEHTGLDVAADLKRELPGLRTILITGYLDVGLEADAAGIVDRILPKPFSLDELLEAISEILDRTGEGHVVL